MNDPAALVALLFAATYAGIALGSVPGLVIDRTGIALLGAILMLVTGAVTTREAVDSVDISTILLLYSLMVVSAQLRLGGFYTKVALGISRWAGRPPLFLALLMGSAALLSALLANDIVCLAFTPVVCAALLRASMNPVPFLIGLAAASNIGSAATIIGNPQNMLIGQVGALSFGAFLLWCAPPALASLGLGYGILLLMYRKKFRLAGGAPRELAGDWPAFDRHQSAKGLALTALLVAMFFTPVPREISAISAAGILLCSRRVATRSILGLIDWHLITLFVALFIVVGGIGKYGIPERALSVFASRGLDFERPAVLSAVTVLLSNIVSNVPAVMLLVGNIGAGNAEGFYLLALMSTFAGNLIIIGSIANIITVEQARRAGVEIGFAEHARAGVPVTAASVCATLLWAWLAHGA